MFRRLKNVVFVVMLFMGGLAFGESADWQLWSEQGITGAFDEQWSITLRQEEKWSDKKGGILEYNIDLGVNYKATSNWILGLNYRQAYGKKRNDWIEENRPHVNVTYKTAFEKFSISDRTRVELRIVEGFSEVVRARNKLTIQSNKGFGTWKPYIADEIFVDSRQGDFNRNRLYIGLKGKPASKLKTEVFALWQTTDRKSYWQDVFSVGLKAYATF